MLNFCTLFDSNYLVKGLSMYHSLKNACADFHLYIFAFDEKSDSILRNLQLEFATIISLKDFEDQELLDVKETRSKGEYCWTCTPSTVLYCIQRFELSHCTYIDADLFFFVDPKVLVEEMGDKDVLITSHRYSAKYDYAATSGKYCVQFVTFKNTTNGLNVLRWWRDACLTWCYARFEDGKFGDQMYLDDWTTRFPGIHELEHLGGGVAPWNMQQYSFQKNGSQIRGVELSSGHQFDLIFFHFHYIHSYQLGFLNMDYLGIYDIPPTVKRLIYLPYLSHLRFQLDFLKTSNICINGLSRNTKSFPKIVKAIAKFILKNDSNYIFRLNKYVAPNRS